jgi:hypothetical protein
MAMRAMIMGETQQKYSPFHRANEEEEEEEEKEEEKA